MPRPHIEFIQAQSLGWSAGATAVPAFGVLHKRLSRDATSGACTSVLRYPAGLHVAERFALACDEELFVLDGELRLNGQAYRRGDYAYIPAGFPRDGLFVDEGSDVLTFYEAEPQLADKAADFDAALLIERVATTELPWGSASDPKVAATAVGRKLLRPDTAEGERTWLLRIETGGDPYALNGVETHPCVEEMFLLEGDIAMATGTLRQGAYFWRPPAVPHGPMGTTAGFVALFRAKEGPFETLWSDAQTGIPWNAEYAPELPTGLADRLADRYDAGQAY